MKVSKTRDDLPAHCYPNFPLEATTPSQHVEEHEENHKKESAIDQQGVLTRDGSPLHGTMLQESSDATQSASIDTSPRRGQHEEKLIDTPTNASIDTSSVDI
ncbi:hypothetical protein Rs2_35586 [Raphanus sativus]|nr:hypothetical protein Rs2_35586 [Raphanus sativus]